MALDNLLYTMLDMLTSPHTRTDVLNAKQGLPMETNIGKLFSLFSWGLQMTHEHAERVKLWDNLDNAQGAVLDRYGANFGVYRNGTDDDYYRLLIKVKMLAQLSGGDIDTVICAASELLGVPAEEIDLAEVFPAKVWIYVDQVIIDEYHMEIIQLIARVMKRIVAAGVGMRLFLRVKHEFHQTLYLNTAVSTYVRLGVNTATEEDQASWQNTTTP